MEDSSLPTLQLNSLLQLPDGREYVIQDGRVYNSSGEFAVLYSPGYGSEWYS